MGEGGEHEPETVLARKAEEDERTVTFTLLVIEGPEAGRSFSVDGSRPARLLVGQSPACELRLSDRQVSRRHAALAVEGRRLRITDLGSSNGTFIDGVSVLDGHLSGGEVVRVGGTALRVEPAAEGDAAPPPAATGFGRTVGASLEMRRIYPFCERLAQSDVTVIIEGETGTGKEVLAESLHERGRRSAGPFVVFDCTAVPENLVESALFGHERGAFTGAVNAHRGVFEEAHGGTLLIDEIGDLEGGLQPKLLRVLERGEVRRVGGDRSIAVDVRVLAATRRNLDQEVQAGRFRDDLFFRLAVARIELPPLRERHGDIAVLAAHFWRIHSLPGDHEPIPYSLLRRFEDYAWPGNVRELSNAVARHIALGNLAEVDAARHGDAAAQARDVLGSVLALDLPLSQARQRVVDEFERRYLTRMLDKHGGNIGRAAEASGIARRYFQLLRARQAR
ncbi:MAG: sigma 54-interacting transcriptional regulator [Polyangiaceae bacterium]